MTIIAENLIMTNDLRLGVGAFWPFLHDEKRIVAKDLDIAEYTAPAPHPMIPHTFVLEPGLKIHKIYNGFWYWGRPSTSELHADLREVTRKMPLGFRPGECGDPRRLAARRKAPLLSIRQIIQADVVRMAGEVDIDSNDRGRWKAVFLSIATLRSRTSIWRAGDCLPASRFVV